MYLCKEDCNKFKAKKPSANSVYGTSFGDVTNDFIFE